MTKLCASPEADIDSAEAAGSGGVVDGEGAQPSSVGQTRLDEDSLLDDFFGGEFAGDSDVASQATEENVDMHPGEVALLEDELFGDAEFWYGAPGEAADTPQGADIVGPDAAPEAEGVASGDHIEAA